MAANMAKHISNDSPSFIGRSTITLKETIGETQPDDTESGTKKSNVNFEFGHDILKGSDGYKKKETQKGNEDDDYDDNYGKKQKDDGKKKKQKGSFDDEGKKEQIREDDGDGKKQKDDEEEDDGEKEVDEKDEQNKVGGKNDWKRTFNDGRNLFESRNMMNENVNQKFQRFGECFLNRGGPNCLVDVTDALESNDYFVYVGPEKLNFNKSRALCVGRNMYLAEVSTPLESDLLKVVMSHRDSDTYWLGMTRDFGDRQLFYWDDGQPTNNFINLAMNSNSIATKEALFCVVKRVSGKEYLRFDCLNQPPDSYPICMYKPGHIIPPALRNIIYTL